MHGEEFSEHQLERERERVVVVVVNWGLGGLSWGFEDDIVVAQDQE